MTIPLRWRFHQFLPPPVNRLQCPPQSQRGRDRRKRQDNPIVCFRPGAMLNGWNAKNPSLVPHGLTASINHPGHVDVAGSSEKIDFPLRPWPLLVVRPPPRFLPYLPSSLTLP
jgi:hypothetical protein